MRPEVILIGASAGGVEALKQVLPRKPVNATIVVVIHIPAHEKSLLPSIFRTEKGPPTREPEDKEPLVPGTIYFAPAGYHLLVDGDRNFCLSVDELVHFCRPAVDMLFESAAETFKAKALGVVLTGSNADGAAGLRRVIDAGGRGIIQAPETANSPEMPTRALALCPEALVLTLPEIRAYLEGC